MMGLDPATADIQSVRDFAVSKEKFGIPDEYEHGYAAHELTFINPSTDQQSETFPIVVWGRQTYAKGAIALALAAIERPSEISNGLHSIMDLINDGIFNHLSTSQQKVMASE